MLRHLRWCLTTALAFSFEAETRQELELDERGTATSRVHIRKQRPSSASSTSAGEVEALRLRLQASEKEVALLKSKLNSLSERSDESSPSSVSSASSSSSSADSAGARRKEEAQHKKSSAFPKVSVVTLMSPLRRDIQWNAMVNFLKQDYLGDLEWLIVDASLQITMSEKSPLVKQLEDYMKQVPNLTPPFVAALQNNQIPGLHGLRSVQILRGEGTIGNMRNVAVNATNNTIVVNMDDDDIYDPTHVTRVVAEFQANPQSVIVYESNVMEYHVAIDGSADMRGTFVDAPFFATTQGLRKDAVVRCPYGDLPIGEEHPMDTCLENHMPSNVPKEQYFRPLTGRSSHGIGMIKLVWENSICAQMWKEDFTKRLDASVGFKAFLGYRGRVSRAIHTLQTLNGGFPVLEKLRGPLAMLGKENIKWFPKTTLPTDKEYDFPQSAKCKDWEVYVSLPPGKTPFNALLSVGVTPGLTSHGVLASDANRSKDHQYQRHDEDRDQQQAHFSYVFEEPDTVAAGKN